MTSQRVMRRKRQAARINPKNVTVLIGGMQPKVLSWKEYQNYLNPKEDEDGAP